MSKFLKDRGEKARFIYKRKRFQREKRVSVKANRPKYAWQILGRARIPVGLDQSEQGTES